MQCIGPVLRAEGDSVDELEKRFLREGEAVKY
jgi:hypothetical protein